MNWKLWQKWMACGDGGVIVSWCLAYVRFEHRVAKMPLVIVRCRIPCNTYECQ